MKPNQQQAVPQQQPMAQPMMDPPSGQIDETIPVSYYENQQSELIRWQLDPSDTLAMIENRLKGMEWDSTLKEFVLRRAALMNDTGVNDVMIFTAAEVDKTTELSEFEDDEIRKVCEEFEHNILDLLFKNYDTYDLDYTKIPNIVAMLGNAVFKTYKRALLGGEREFLKPMVHHREVHYSQPEQGGMGGGNKKKGFWNIFKN